MRNAASVKAQANAWRDKGNMDTAKREKGSTLFLFLFFVFCFLFFVFNKIEYF